MNLNIYLKVNEFIMEMNIDTMKLMRYTLDNSSHLRDAFNKKKSIKQGNKIEGTFFSSRPPLPP